MAASTRPSGAPSTSTRRNSCRMSPNRSSKPLDHLAYEKAAGLEVPGQPLPAQADQPTIEDPRRPGHPPVQAQMAKGAVRPRRSRSPSGAMPERSAPASRAAATAASLTTSGEGERTRQFLEPVRHVDGIADHRELEPLRAADVAHGDGASMQADANRDRRLARPRAFACSTPERLRACPAHRQALAPRRPRPLRVCRT